MKFVNIHLCKLATLLQMFSLESSVWLLVTMSIERYLSIKFKNWRSVYFNSKKAAITGCLVLVIMFLSNIHVLATIDFSKFENYTGEDICIHTEGFIDSQFVRCCLEWNLIYLKYILFLYLYRCTLTCTVYYLL